MQLTSKRSAKPRGGTMPSHHPRWGRGVAHHPGCWREPSPRRSSSTASSAHVARDDLVNHTLCLLAHKLRIILLDVIPVLATAVGAASVRRVSMLGTPEVVNV